MAQVEGEKDQYQYPPSYLEREREIWPSQQCLPPSYYQLVTVKETTKDSKQATYTLKIACYPNTNLLANNMNINKILACYLFLRGDLTILIKGPISLHAKQVFLNGEP